MLDLYCLMIGAGKSQQKVIGIAYVAQPPEVWVCWVMGRQGLHLLSNSLDGFGVMSAPCCSDEAGQAVIFRVCPSCGSLGVLREDVFLDVPIQFVEEDVR